MTKFLENLLSQTATWLVGALIAILTVFSTRIIEAVKFQINRADQRTKQYEEIAAQVSHHIFAAEVIAEFIEHDWTTKATMTDLLKDYNDSIRELRKKEFVYCAWIQKFWGKDQKNQFNSFMESVRKFDTTIHSLNDEFEAVNITASKPKVDKKRGEEALNVMNPALKEMRQQGNALLTAMDTSPGILRCCR